jgi:glutaredoxin 2
MALGYLDLAYESVVLPYNDETTPIKLCGAKMLPILSLDGKPMNESLEIIAAVDRDNRLKVRELTADPAHAELEGLLTKLGTNVHSLAMPYWIYTPEFDDRSRAYFTKKKELKRGPFAELVWGRKEFEAGLLQDLRELQNFLTPFYRSAEISLYDILLASHLWGLYVVPEFQFPPSVHAYLQAVKERCRFNYHRDFWN